MNIGNTLKLSFILVIVLLVAGCSSSTRTPHQPVRKAALTPLPDEPKQEEQKKDDQKDDQKSKDHDHERRTDQTEIIEHQNNGNTGARTSTPFGPPDGDPYEAIGGGSGAIVVKAQGCRLLNNGSPARIRCWLFVVNNGSTDVTVKVEDSRNSLDDRGNKLESLYPDIRWSDGSRGTTVAPNPRAKAVFTMDMDDVVTPSEISTLRVTLMLGERIDFTYVTFQNIKVVS